MANGAQHTGKAVCNRPPIAINRKPTVVLLTPLTYGVQYLFTGLGHVPNWVARGGGHLALATAQNFLTSNIPIFIVRGWLTSETDHNPLP